MTFDEFLLALDHSDRPDAMALRLFDIRGFGGGNRADDLLIVSGVRQWGEILGPKIGERLLGKLSGTEAQTVVGEIGDSDAVANGLACGGSVSVMAHSLGWLAPLRPFLEARTPCAVVTTFDEDSRPCGVDVVASMTKADTADLQAGSAVLARGRAGVALVPVADHVVHVQCFFPATRLVVVGEGLLADGLRRQGVLLGLEVMSVPSSEPLPVVGGADGVIVLDHDHDAVTPLLHRLLQTTDVPYIGSLGSRGTQEERRRRLVACGCGGELDRIYGPAGLDLGSRSTEETALAILAELLSVLRGRTGAHLRDATGPING